MKMACTRTARFFDVGGTRRRWQYLIVVCCAKIGVIAIRRQRHALAPAWCPISCHRKMLDDTRTVLASCQHISHACLVNIKAAELGYLSLILLSFVKFYVMLGAIDMPLQCFALLGLWRPLCDLLHAQARCDFLRGQAMANMLIYRRHGELPFATH